MLAPIKWLIAKLREKIALLEDELRNVRRQKEDLEYKYNLLRSKVFGPKTEKASGEDENQYRLFDEIEETVSPPRTNKSVPGNGRKKTRKNRRSDWMERVEFKDVVHDLDEGEKTCPCGSPMSRIGEEVSHKLDIRPPEITGERHVRLKYACKSCEGTENEEEGAVLTAKAPEQIIPKSMATPGLLAHLAASKFVDHLPFYRMEAILSRLGVLLPRATMCNWMIQIHKRCERLRELQKEDLLRMPVLGADETVLQVMKEPGRANTAESRMWAFFGHCRDRPVLLFFYHPTRSAKFLEGFLPGFKGCIQSDGFGVYKSFTKRHGLLHAECWAHVRREFFKLSKQFPSSELANEALGLIRRLYVVERVAKQKELSFDEMLELRKSKSEPTLVALKKLLDDNLAKVNPAGPAGEAIKYALNRWPALLAYLSDGRIPIDNNLVENMIRPFVVGRKNWLFSGGPRGAHASAWLYTLIESAKANGMEPYWYLRHLFENLPKAKTDDELRALLPHRMDRSLVKPLVRPARYSRASD